MVDAEWILYCGRTVSVYIQSLGELPRSGFPSFGYPAEQFWLKLIN
jgi:hypothetical protein